MPEPKPIYRTNGMWVALVQAGHLYDTTGEWIGWLDGDDVYTIEGNYAGYISQDGRLLRQRVSRDRKSRRPSTQQPRIQPPHTVPLAPLFAELDFSTIGVFEEHPDIFGLPNERRPGSGEKPPLRLVVSDPHVIANQKLSKAEQDSLEQMVRGLIHSYRATAPPVPVEAMAAGLQPENAGSVETGFPLERQRMAENMIERLGHLTWAIERGYCGPEGFSPAQVLYAARALLLPRDWLLALPKEQREPAALAHNYVVPQETAMLRMQDLE